MTGERDLRTILNTMTVSRRAGTFVYVSLPAGAPWSGVEPAAAVVAEDEGTTVVVERAVAERLGLVWTFEAAWLTIEIATALDGVGLTAALAGALADIGVACNVLAGFHHDHLLVPVARVDDALRALRTLGDRSRADAAPGTAGG